MRFVKNTVLSSLISLQWRSQGLEVGGRGTEICRGPEAEPQWWPWGSGGFSAGS